MKMRLSTRQRVLIALVCFTVAIIGFMLKLPAGFRHIDKELHATFYFLAAALLNLLFAKTKLVRHLLLFVGLYVFGMVIEFSQAYSNRFFRKRIHGRFDPEDIQWNLKGLVAFSLIWILSVVVLAAYRKAATKNKNYNSKIS